MKQRKCVQEQVVVIEKDSAYTREELIDLINKAHDAVTNAVGKISFEVEHKENYGYYDQRSTHSANLVMTYNRYENDDEYNRREALTAQTKAAHEAQLKAEYERLKKLFGS